MISNLVLHDLLPLPPEQGKLPAVEGKPPVEEGTFPAEGGKFIHEDLGDADQRLALYILSQKNFVPEHVESRTLYNPMQPHISQVRVRVRVCTCHEPHMSHVCVCACVDVCVCVRMCVFIMIPFPSPGLPTHVGRHIPQRGQHPPTVRHLSQGAREVCPSYRGLEHQGCST